MKPQRVCALYYSATGTTDRVVNTIAEALAQKLELPLERFGFTKPAERDKEYHFTENDLVVVGSPTYAGKLPNKILPDFQTRLHGGGALAVAVVLFGNRSYDNSLAGAVRGIGGERLPYHSRRRFCRTPRLYRCLGRGPSRLGR